jgi:hypothetical protein
MQKWLHECSAMFRLYVHCLSYYLFINITHVINLVITSLPVTTNKCGMLIKEENLFSPLLGVLIFLRSTTVQYPTKSVNLCRICAFQKLVLKVNVKFALEQATKAHRGSRGIALLFL